MKLLTSEKVKVYSEIFDQCKGIVHVTNKQMVLFMGSKVGAEFHPVLGPLPWLRLTNILVTIHNDL